MDTPLVTSDQVCAATGAEKNRDGTRLSVLIPVAQRRFLRPALGAALYDALLAADRTSAPWAALLTALTPALCWWTMQHGWALLQVHLTNAGVTMRTGRDSTTADLRAADAALVTVRETAESYAAELATFLTTNAADYAAYLATRADVPKTATGLLGGIYF